MKDPQEIKQYHEDLEKGAGILRHFEKAAAQEGEQHTWKDGKKYKKQGGKWVPVTEGKQDGSKQDSKSNDSKQQQQGAQSSSKPQDKQSGGGGMEGATKQDVAQLRLLKDLLDSKADMSKISALFSSLSPTAQNAIPQEIHDQIVKHQFESETGDSDDEQALKDVFAKKEEDDDLSELPQDWHGEKDSLNDELDVLADEIIKQLEHDDAESTEFDESQYIDDAVIETVWDLMGEAGLLDEEDIAGSFKAQDYYIGKLKKTIKQKLNK